MQLTPQERNALIFNGRRTARIVLRHAEGATYRELQAEFRCGPNLIAASVRAFQQRGVEGLVRRNGRPKKRTFAVALRVLELGRLRRDTGAPALGLREIGRACGISAPTVATIFERQLLSMPSLYVYWRDTAEEVLRNSLSASRLDLVGVLMEPGFHVAVFLVRREEHVQGATELAERGFAPVRWLVDEPFSGRRLHRFLLEIYIRYGPKTLVIADGFRNGSVRRITRAMDRAVQATASVVGTYRPWRRWVQRYLEKINRDLPTERPRRKRQRLAQRILPILDALRSRRRPAVWIVEARRETSWQKAWRTGRYPDADGSCR